MPLPPEIMRKIQDVVRQVESEQTDPKILITGATGVGKSSLVNAIFGKKLAAVKTVESTTRSFTTHEYEIEPGARVQITDSPGYGEVGRDEEYSRNVVVEAARAHAVSLVLKADEKGYERDLKIIDLAGRDPQFALEKPILIVMNQIDKIKPTREWSPPYQLDLPPSPNDSEKVRNMKDKVALVRAQFTEIIGKRTIHVIPAMCDPDEGPTFGIDVFKMRMFQAMPDAARFRFARAARLAEKASAEVLEQLDKEAGKIVGAAAGAAASAVLLNPVPFTDFLALAPIQIGMIIKLGAIYGRTLDPATAIEVLGALGAGIAARTIFQGIISLIPTGKQFLGAPYAAASTHGMGVAARRYFKGKGVPTEAELREIVQDELKRRES